MRVVLLDLLAVRVRGRDAPAREDARCAIACDAHDRHDADRLHGRRNPFVTHCRRGSVLRRRTADMRNTKRHRYVSRSGPARDARWEALALARAENEGWPTDAPKWHKTRKVAPPPPAP
jgi:hypothetical protein